MDLVSTILLSYAIFIATVCASSPQIHTQMSRDDLRKVFQVDSHDQVPEYEVVPVRLIAKRSTSSQASETQGVDNSDDVKQLHLSAFGRRMHLKLKPNTEFQSRAERMKVLMAESAAGGLKYEEVNPDDSRESIGNSYHDEKNMAAILMDSRPTGQVELHGTIGNDLVIRPVPESIARQSDEDDEMFLDEEEAYDKLHESQMRRINGTTTIPKIKSLVNNNNYKSKKSAQVPKKGAHIVYKRKLSPEDHHSDYLELEPSTSSLWKKDAAVSHLNETRSRRTKRQAPDSVWPEVLLVVDYDSYILHGATSRDVKRYFISFWNGVDLRYKLLAHPSIRVSLAGMIVAKDRDATPYLERNRLRAPNADAVDAAGALTDMGKYLYREDRLPTYDLAVVITKLDMCRRRYEGGRCNRGTAGFAYVGGACVVNKRLEKVNSVAIIEDSGGFSGIIVAAHEVGHLLGCVHDGSPPPSYLGGPGATRCPWEDGFIMSDLRHTERGFRWSSCSVEQFKHFLNGETATCLYNYPHENQILPRVLPGTMLTLDEQCKRDRGTNACFKDARVCAQLFCFDSASGYCVSYRPAAEGSPCGDGQVCRNGKCVAELENIIPDYTHVTQTVISRRDSQHVPLADSDTSAVPPITTSRRRSRAHKKHQQDLVANTPINSNHPVRGPLIGPPQSSPQAPQSPPQSAAPIAPVVPVNNNNEFSPNPVASPRCEDAVERMAGSLSCAEFLERFGYRYCTHNYIKRNCCASHALVCKPGQK